VAGRAVRSRPDLKEFRLRLHDWATELTSRHTVFPVRIGKICHDLRIAITRNAHVAERRAYLAVDPSKDQSVTIILPGKNNNASASIVSHFERFCVAHELAHYLIFVDFKCRPQTRSEYWQHEDICDEFARRLLIPDAAVGYNTDELPNLETDYLVLCNQLAASAMVPWMQAAIRLTERTRTAIYLRCERIPSGSLRIVSTSLPGRKATKVLREEWPLSETLEQLLCTAKAKQCAVHKDITTSLQQCEAVAAALPGEVAGAVAEAQHGRYPDIRIAVTLSSG
jgi:hypothetical protein